MIGRKSLLIFSTLVVTFAFQLVGMLFLTHYYPQEVYGSITWALSLVGMLDCLANLGFNSAHVKRVSEGKDLGDCVSTFVVLKLALTFSMAVIIIASLYVWTGVLGNFLRAEERGLVEIFVLYQVMYDLVSISILTFNARTEMSKAYLVNLLDPIVRIPLIAIISLGGGDIYQLSLAYIVGSSLVLIVGLFLLRKERIPWKRPTLFRSYLAFAAPMAPIAILDTVSNNIDKILIGGYVNATGVAYYASAKYLLCGLGAVGLAISLNAFPTFSRCCSKGDFKEVRRMAREAERFISILVTPLAIVLILFPTEVCIFLFGYTYSSAGEPLRYLTIATLVIILNQVYLSQIPAVNKPRTSAKIALLDFLVFLALMLYLIPPTVLGFKGADMSFVGAAVAAAVTSVITMTVTRLVVIRYTGSRPNPRMLLHAAAGFVTGVFLAIFSTYLTPHEIYGVVLYGLLAYAMFEGLLYLFKELSRRDLAYLMDLFSLPEMFKYIRSEFRGKR